MGKPSIPTSRIKDKPTRDAIEALSEAFRQGEGRHGKIEDKWITWGELEQRGFATLRSDSLRPGQGGKTPAPTPAEECTGTPPEPKNLTATGAFGTIILEFDDPSSQYGCHSYTEFWRNDSDDFSTGVRAGSTQASLWADAIGNDATRYYWARHVNRDGTPGPWAGPVFASTSKDPAYVLDTLQGEITETQLHSDLNSRIDLIDVDAGLTGRLSELSLIEVSDKLERRLTQREQEAKAELSSLMDGASEGLMEALMRANETINRERYTRDDHYHFKDAIADVDPDTGTITLKAVEQLKDGSTQTISDLESSIQVNSDEIQLRATKTELDNTAQDIIEGFQPAYSADWFDSKENWTASGATLTANGDSTVTLDSDGTTPQMEVSGLSFDGGDNSRVQILMKRVAGSGWAGKLWWATADHGFGDTYDDGTTVYDTVATFSEIADDNEYHVTYLALRDFDDWVNNTITGLRVQFGNTTDDIFDIDRFEVGKSQIEQLIYDDLEARISDNESTLSVHSDKIEARVTQTTFDGAENRITQNESDIQANADAITLKASQSQVDDHGSRLDTAEQDIDAAEGKISSQVLSTTRLWEAENAGERGPEALMEALLGEWEDFAREQDTRGRVAIAESTLTANTDDISANASSITTLEGRVDGNEGTIQDILELDIGTDTALLSRFNTLQGEVDDNEASITSEEQARITADEAEATRRSDQFATLDQGGDDLAEAALEQLLANETVFIGNMAAIHRESVTRQTEDESQAQDITSLGASLDTTQANLQEEKTTRATKDQAFARQTMALSGTASKADIPSYDSGTTYDQEELVYYNGSLYRCLEDGVSGVTPSDSADEWQQVDVLPEQIDADIQENNEVRIGYCLKNGDTTNDPDQTSCENNGGTWYPDRALAEAAKQLQVQKSDGSYAAIQSAMDVYAGEVDNLGAQWTLKQDVNGHVAGVGLATTSNEQGNVTSEFIVRADKIALGIPAQTWDSGITYSAGDYARPTTSGDPGAGLIYRADNDGTTGNSEPDWPTTVGNTVTDGGITWVAENEGDQYPFVIGTVEGEQVVTISNAAIEDASITNAKIKEITADKISVTELSAISADMGDISAGRLATGYDDNDTPTGPVFLDLNNGYFEIQDDSGNTFLRSGAPGVGDVVHAGNKIPKDGASTYIEDLAIDTLQIRDQAVTFPQSDYAGSSQDIDGTPTNKIAGVEFKSTGAPISINASTLLTSGNISDAAMYTTPAQDRYGYKVILWRGLWDGSSYNWDKMYETPYFGRQYAAQATQSEDYVYEWLGDFPFSASISSEVHGNQWVKFQLYAGADTPDGVAHASNTNIQILETRDHGRTL